MIDWILQRPPHTCHPAEVRVAERLRTLADSPHPWTVIWGYYGKNPSSPGGKNPASVIPPTSSSSTPSPTSPKARSATAAAESARRGRHALPCTEPFPISECQLSEFPHLPHPPIRHTSIHKAKGLDSKAVILIGMPPQKSLASDYDAYSWFMAVSRARQLLAVVETA